MDIGKSIRVALAKKNILKVDLAKSLGCTSSNISQILKTGRVRSETIVRMAEIFEMQVSDFIKLGED